MFTMFVRYLYKFVIYILFILFFISPFLNPSLCFGRNGGGDDVGFRYKVMTDYLFKTSVEEGELIFDIDTNLFSMLPLNTKDGQPAPYLFLDKMDDYGGVVNVGSEHDYKIVVSNKGSISFYGVVAKDVIPGGFTYVRGSSRLDGTVVADPANINGQLVFKIGDLPSYTKKTIDYKVKVISNTVDGNYYSLTYAMGKYFDPTTKSIRIYESESDVSDITAVGQKYYSAKVSSEVLGVSISRLTNKVELLSLSILIVVFLLLFGRKIVFKLFRSSLLAFVLMTLYLFIFPSSVKAVSDIVLLQDLPEYINTNNFKLSYTALSDSPVNAKFYVKKNGDTSWRQFAWRSGCSGWVQVSEPSVIYSGDGKYVFKVEISGGLVSDESATIIDRTLPGPVSGFKSEKTDSGIYKLSWRNPDIDDFSKVVVYRSTAKHFTADNSTKVGEVSGNGDSEAVWENVLNYGGEYYYALRVIDKAGNASGLVSDPRTTIVAGESASTSNPEYDYMPTGREENNLDHENSLNIQKGKGSLSKMVIIYGLLVVCVVLYIFYEYRKLINLKKKRHFIRKNR